MKRLKNAKKMIERNARRILSVVLTIALLITTTGISELIAMAGDYPNITDSQLAEMLKIIDSSVVDQSSISFTTKTKGGTDANGVYSESQEFTTAMVFNITEDFSKAAYEEYKERKENSQPDKEYKFYYKLPSEIMYKGTADGPLTESQHDEGPFYPAQGHFLGKYEIMEKDDGTQYIVFTVMARYFADEVNNKPKLDQVVKFDCDYKVDATEIGDDNNLNFVFPGTGNITTLKFEEPKATGYKSADSWNVTSKADGYYMQYHASVTTNGRTSKELVITDTYGDNIDPVLSSMEIKANKGVTLTASDYTVFKNSLDNTVTITINKELPIETTVSINYEAKFNDSKLDDNSDGNIDGLDNEIEWKVNNGPKGSASVDPTVPLIGSSVAMNKGSNTTGDTINWTITLNDSLMKSSLKGYKLSDSVVYSSTDAGFTPDFDVKDFVVKDVDANITLTKGTDYVLTGPNASGAFDIEFKDTANVTDHKYTIEYKSQLKNYSDLAIDNSATAKNTATLKDSSNKNVGSRTHEGKVTNNYSISAKKEAVGDFDIVNKTQKWRVTFTAGNADSYLQGTPGKPLKIYDRISNGDQSWNNYYGSTFIQVSLKISAVKSDGTSVDSLTPKSKTFSQSSSDHDEDILEIVIEDDIAYKSITLEYETVDDGSNMTSSGKTIENYSYIVNKDKKYEAWANTHYNTLNSAKGMLKNGKFKDGTDGKVASWEVWVNSENTYDRSGKGVLEGPLVITDILPKDEVDAPTNVKIIAYNGEYYGSHQITDLTDAATKDDASFASDGKYIITIPKATLETIKKNDGSICTNPVIVITYDTNVKSYKDITNTVSATSDGTSIGQAVKTISQSESLLKKDGHETTSDKTTIIYNVDINPRGYQMNGGNSLVLSDTLDHRVDIIPSSIKVVATDGRTALVEGADYYINYESVNRTLTITVPDERAMKLTYYVKPNLAYFPGNGSEAPVTITNSIKLKGHEDEGSSYTFSGNISNSKGSITGDTVKYRVIKVDADSPKTRLAGAEFELQKLKLDGTFDPITGPFVTNTYGNIEFDNIETDYLYRYKEKTAPTGYSCDASRWYYFIIKSEAANTVTYNNTVSLLLSLGVSIADVDLGLKANGTRENIVTNSKDTTDGTISITKIDATTKAPVAGAELEILWSNDEGLTKNSCIPAIKWTSNGAPYVIKTSEITAAAPGATSYYVHEIKAPAGYVLNTTDKKFTLPTVGNTTTVEFENAKNIIQISKVQGNGITPLAGATLVIEDTVGNTIVSPWVSTDVPVDITGKLEAGKSYILKELVTPDGYESAGQIPFTVDKNGKVKYTKTYYNADSTVKATDFADFDSSVVIMRNYKTTITTVSKVDSEGNPVVNAELELYATNSDGNKTGSAIDSWNSTMTAHTIYGLEAGKKYVIVEKKAPTGYVKAPDEAFTVGPTGATVTIVDAKAKATTVNIFKYKTSTSIFVAGAELQILDADNLDAVVDIKATGITVSSNNASLYIDPAEKSFVTTGYEVVIDGLPAGNYKLHELTAPTGYELADDLPFTVVAGQANPVIMYDAKLVSSAKITKEDDSHNALAGAVITLYTAEDLGGGNHGYKDGTSTQVGTPFTTTVSENSHTFENLEIGEWYVFRETTVPTGYKVAPDIVFRAKAGNQDFTMVNAKLDTHDVIIHKTDESGSLLDGATLKLTELETGSDYTYDTTVLLKTTSNEITLTPTGTGIFEALSIGNDKYYLLEETTRPTGYAKSEPIIIYVTNDWKINYQYGASSGPIYEDVAYVQMVDEREPFIIKKVDQDYNPLTGADLELHNDTDNVYVTGWSSANSEYKYTLISGNKYTLSEKAAPEGYQLAKSITFTYNSDNTITILKIGGVAVDSTDLKYKNLKTLEMVDEKISFNVEKIKPDTTALKDAVLNIYKATSSGSGDYIYQTTHYNKSGSSIKTIITGTAPATVTSDGSDFKVGEFYILEETTTPTGYLKSSPIVFTINPDSTVNYYYNGVLYVNQTSIVMRDSDMTVLTISKVTEGGNLLKGAGLSLYKAGGTYAGSTTSAANKDGAAIESWTSTNLSPKTITGLEPGYYILEETTVPAGYIKADEIVIHIKDDGTIEYRKNDTSDVWKTVTAIALEDKELIVKIEKVKNIGGMPLGGAELQILDSHGTVVASWESGDTLAYEAKGLKVGETYTLHEVSAPNGYKEADDIVFTIAEDGTITDENGATLTTVIMEDEAVPSVIVRKFSEFGAQIAGAKLVIYEAEGDGFGGWIKKSGAVAIETWTSDGSEHYVDTSNLNPGADYVVVEEKAPTGYKLLDKPEHFVCPAPGYVETVVVTNRKAPLTTTEVQITKLDNYGNMLAGARLQIIDASGNVVADWTSSSSAIKIIDSLLYEGEEYTLHEVSAPAGYSLAADVKFTVKPAGEITYVKMNDSKIYKTDKPSVKVEDTPSTDTSVIDYRPELGSFSFKKKAVGDDAGLVGAKLAIYAGNTTEGAPLYTWTTGEYGQVFYMNESNIRVEGSNVQLTPATYTVTELEAPVGYIVAEPITFNVTISGDVTVISGPAEMPYSNMLIMRDKKAKLYLDKIDEATGEGLAGALFKLYTVEGYNNNSDAILVINTTGNEIPLPADIVPDTEYILEEIQAPQGYVRLARFIRFKVDSSGNLSFTDEESKNAATIVTSSDGQWNKIVIKNKKTRASDTSISVGPKTGDNGRFAFWLLFTLFGFALSIFSVRLLLTERKREE